MNLVVSSMGILARIIFHSLNMIYFSIYLWHFQCLSSSLTVFRLQFFYFLGNIILRYFILFSAIINRIILFFFSPVSLLLVYRNTSNFMLIFLYLYWIHLFVLIVFVCVCVESLGFPICSVMSSVGSTVLLHPFQFGWIFKSFQG